MQHLLMSDTSSSCEEKTVFIYGHFVGGTGDVRGSEQFNDSRVKQGRFVQRVIYKSNHYEWLISVMLKFHTQHPRHMLTQRLIVCCWHALLLTLLLVVTLSISHFCLVNWPRASVGARGNRNFPLLAKWIRYRLNYKSSGAVFFLVAASSAFIRVET